MKRRIVVIFLIIIAICIFSSCEKESGMSLGYKALDYVELFDYKNLTVSKDFVEVSDDEIKMVIEADLDSRGIYKEITDRNIIQENDIILCDIIGVDSANDNLNYFLFTDSDVLPENIMKKLIGMHTGENLKINMEDIFDIGISNISIKGIYEFAKAEDDEIVLEMYSCVNMEEVYDYVVEKTRGTIILNYALDEIMEKSKIKKFPEQAKMFVNNKMNEKENFQDDKSFEEYIGMTLKEYEENIYSIYYEYMIYSAIAERENIICSESEFEETVTEISNEANITEEEVLKLFDREYIMFRAICDEVEKTVLSYATIVD